VDKKELPNENEEKKVTSKFLEIYSKIDKDKPTKENLKEIQEYVSETQNPSITLQRLSQNLTEHLINETFGANGMKIEPLLKGIDEMRNELGYSSSSTIEQLLIDEIILEFLRTYHMQLALTTFTTNKGIDLKNIKKFDELLNSAQARFHKSIQTLMKLRKSGVKLQINIATEGGKQVNLQK